MNDKWKVTDYNFDLSAKATEESYRTSHNRKPSNTSIAKLLKLAVVSEGSEYRARRHSIPTDTIEGINELLISMGESQSRVVLQYAKTT